MAKKIKKTKKPGDLVREPELVQMIIEAAQLRDARKAIEAKENPLKDQLKAVMETKGVEKLTTLSGHKAEREKKPGFVRYDFVAMAKDLNLSGPEAFDKYKRQTPFYALTVTGPE